MFILRVAREDLQIAQTSMALLNKIQSVPSAVCKIRVLHVGGTLEKVEKALKRMTESWLESQMKKAEMI